MGMFKYVIRRIILVPIILILVGLIIYLFMSLSPTDPVPQMLPSEFTMEQYEAQKAAMGLDKPVIVQYANWLLNAVQGNLGVSWVTRAHVWDELQTRIPISLKFSVLTMIVIIVIGLPLGVMCAVKQYSVFDQATNIISKIFGSLPGFLLGLLLMLIFAKKLGWFPVYGTGTWKHWVLPVATQFFPFCANYIRQARSAMLDCTRQDYVRTARSKGARESSVIFRDTLRNALLPIITLTGSNFAILISGAVVVENVFSIPGVGSKLVEAINAKDLPMVVACAMVLAVIFAVVQLLIDISYAFIDPRVKGALLKGSMRKKAPKLEVKNRG